MSFLKRGILKNLTKSLENVTEMGKEAVIDRDKLYQLKADIISQITNLMMTGKGAGLTKITICGLTAWIIGVVSWVFLKTPENMTYVKDFAIISGSLIGIITGGYVSGSSFKRSKWSRKE